MEERMMLRPMTNVERMYSYTQSEQIMAQAGCVGHLRADFGTDGNEFFFSWDDHREGLRSANFLQEFDEVIGALREDAQFEGILKNRSAMASYCRSHCAGAFGNNREYGFRADTSHYSYLLRLNPNRGEYNLYCYCYVRQWLERHMRQAEKGIRFITPDYKEKFRIADGDKVRYFTKSGGERELTCRYIDDSHFLAGGELRETIYHIREFADQYERHGCQGIIPLRRSLPEMCFSVQETTGEQIVITRGKAGYTLANEDLNALPSREAADAANQAMGVTKAQEAAMVAGSMFGWDTPAADPKHYDEQGMPIRTKMKDQMER